MEDLRRLVRATVYVVRQWWRLPHSRRRIYGVLLGVVVGVIGWFLTQRTLPEVVRRSLVWVAVGLLALWLVWWGVRVGRWVALGLRFAQHMRYRETEAIVLSYDASLESVADQLVHIAHAALAEARRFLQSPNQPTMRVWVYVAPTEQYELLHSSPLEFGGRAHQSAVAIEVVYRGDLEQVQRTMRHEFAHLITACWYEAAPALFKEGIAEATEHHDDALTLHRDALYYLYAYPSYPLVALLEDTRFYAQEWRYATYAWAGSFTWYLLEQFGLARFRRFYHRLAHQSVEAAFHAEFAMSFGQAELLWRNYLHTQLPEPARTEALSHALRDSLEWYLEEGQGLARVKALSEMAVRELPNHWLGYYGLAYCAFWQGDVETALRWMEQAAVATEQEHSALRGSAWMHHGLICDLLGKRERALECYRTALTYPDYTKPNLQYHTRARKHLEVPYTYTERVARAQQAG